jgi:hypothetical protein
VIVVGRTSLSGWVPVPYVLVPSDVVFGRFDLSSSPAQLPHLDILFV